MDSSQDYLNSIPPELQSLILGYLTGFSKIALCEVSPQIKAFIDSQPASCWDFGDTKMLTTDRLKDLTSRIGEKIVFMSLRYNLWIGYPQLQSSLTGCRNLTHLDLIQTDVGAPLLTKILIECTKLTSLGWTLDGTKQLGIHKTIGPRHGKSKTARNRKKPPELNSADIDAAKKTLHNVKVLKLAGYDGRKSSVWTACGKWVGQNNFEFLIKQSSHELVSLTLVAQHGPKELSRANTRARDVLNDSDSGKQVISLVRAHIDKNLRWEKSCFKLKEMTLEWTGVSFGSSEISFADFFTQHLLTLACHFNQHQDIAPSIRFRKLTIPSITGRLLFLYEDKFPNLKNQTAFDTSELEELTLFTFVWHHSNRWFPPPEFSTKLIDFDEMPRLKVLRVFCDTVEETDLATRAFTSESLERLQIRRSPGVETVSRTAFSNSLLKSLGDVLSACANLTHLDIGQFCIYERPYSLATSEIVPFDVFGNLTPPCLSELKGVVLPACIAATSQNGQKGNLELLVALSPKLETVELLSHEHISSIDHKPDGYGATFDHDADARSAKANPCYNRLRSETLYDPSPPLCSLTELRSLTVATVGFRPFQLEPLSQSCLALRHLSLSQHGVDFTGAMAADLASALENFRSLVDLRVDHDEFKILNRSIWKSLRKCASLERITFICANVSISKSASVELTRSLAFLPKLIAFQLFSATDDDICQRIKEGILAERKRRVPGFHVLIETGNGTDFKDIPLDHWNEMTTLTSRVFPGFFL